MSFEYDVKGKGTEKKVVPAKKEDAPVLKQTGRPLSFDKGVPGKKSSVTLPVDTWVVLKEALLRTCPEFRTQNELINAAVLEYVEKRKSN